MRQWIAAILLCLAVAGCSNMTTQQQRTLSGGAIGAGSGAVIGAIAGNAGLGAAIGAGTGVLGGFLYDQYNQRKEESFRQGYEAGRRSSSP